MRHFAWHPCWDSVCNRIVKAEGLPPKGYTVVRGSWNALSQNTLEIRHTVLAAVGRMVDHMVRETRA